MKAKELRQEDIDQLQDRLVELRKSQFNLRVQRATGQISEVSQFSKVRRDIAIVKTVMREKSGQDKK